MVEPVRGIVFDVKRYALHDGPGIRVTVHLKGCPLSCWWCHNPEGQDFNPRLLFRGNRCIACDRCLCSCPRGAISAEEGRMTTDSNLCLACGRCAEACPSGAREICGREMSALDVVEAVMKERIFLEQSGGGVTLSGGEPFEQPEFVYAILEECKRRGIRTAIDTSGFAEADVLLDTTSLTDLYLYDVKHMDPERHKEYTGVDNDIILSNLRKLRESGAAIVARMPFIPGVNTDDVNLRATGEFLAKVGGVAALSLLPYHSAAEDKHGRWGMDYRLSGALPPTEYSLRRAAGIIEGCGVKVAIGG
ncbi:MAG: glycyl-radical enzyme activating protein [Synergistaceae bacterium]|jgi:pyruvate formate lyase activating enzyme|nr:glycyl-radical enzyme activating protein [Synergistaceae bacterium]